MASIHDVAAAAGVSAGTVSNVLNHPGRVSPATVRKVQEAIIKLGFVRSDAARQLRIGRSVTIGLILLDVRNPFYADLAQGAEDRAAAAGYSVLLGNSNANEERERTYLSLFEKQRVHGVLISSIKDIEPRLADLRRKGIATVLVDRPSHAPETSSIAIDDVAGGRLAAEHLLGIGRRRLVFVGGPDTLRQHHDRLVGVREALAAHPDASLEVITAESPTVLQGRAAGERILARPAWRRPDAVFAGNDLLAVGVLQAIVLHRSLRVPDDIALIGYDDIAFASSTMVPLTSIRQPAEAMGARAVELLFDAAAGKPSTQLSYPPELIVRGSTVLDAPLD